MVDGDPHDWLVGLQFPFESVKKMVLATFYTFTGCGYCKCLHNSRNSKQSPKLEEALKSCNNRLSIKKTVIRTKDKRKVAKKINFKFYQSHKESEIVNVIKLQRIKWEGHLVRMDEDCTPKKVSMHNQLAKKGRAGQILDGLMVYKNIS
ncbi:hypothetical protein TNCV_3477171 [Trichonephila clavipes]|nr:hypothetical protein TNCV_3477171 [Trichonephila clavipes]